MKKIFKLFPAALAVIALASCSNDDLLNINGQEFKKDPNKLYVTVAENDAETRAGFAEGQNDAGKTVRSVVFNANDQIKLYDDQHNWRPQLWKYSGTIGKYTNSDGVTVFDAPANAYATAAGAHYASGYGVYPYNAGVFLDENRSAFSVDLTPIGFINYETVPTTVLTDGTEFKTPMYLWGTASDGEMTLNHLTGYLRVNISDVKANTAGKASYLLVQAKGSDDKGIQLHENYDGSTDAKTLAFDPDADLKTAVVALKQNTTGAAMNALTATVPVTPATVYADMIVVKLPTIAAETRSYVVYVPMIPGEKTIKVSLVEDAPVAATIDATGANTKLIQERTLTVEAGKFYKFADPAEYDLTVNTLNLLETKIADIDGNSDRDLTITLNENIPVKNGADADAYQLDIPALKHDVTLQFAAGHGFIKDADAGGDLIITTQSGKKLTFVNSASSTITSVTAVNSGDLKIDGPLVLKGNYTTIYAGAENLTVQAAVTTVNASGVFNFNGINDAGDAVYNIGTLNLYNGANTINVLNGTIEKIEYTPQATVAKKAENVTGTVNVYSEGISGFKVPVATTAAAKNGTTTFEYTSKLTVAPATITTIFNTEDAAKIAETNIFTAAQLAAIKNSGAYTIKAKEIDLNGSQIEWAPIALTQDLNGGYAGGATDKNVSRVKIKNVTVKKTTANFEDGLGLFQTSTGNISNLILENVTISATGLASKNIGALAGKAEGTITNVTLQGTNTISAAGLSENIGALIGATTDDVTLLDVTVAGTTAITGYINLGGFIGLAADGNDVTIAAAKYAAATPFARSAAAANEYNAANGYCTVTGVTFSQNTKAGTQYVPAYAKIGDFIGSVEISDAADQGVITIYKASTQTELARPANYTNNAKFTYLDGEGAAIYYGIGRDQQLVGLSGIAIATKTPITDKSGNDLSIAILTAPATGKNYTNTPYVVENAAGNCDAPARGTGGADINTKFINWIVK